MKKSDGGSRGNNSHKTRFSKDYQPKRRRGPARRNKADCNMFRMLAEVLGEPVPVGTENGKTVSMSSARALVKSMRNDALMGGPNDRIKYWDRLAKHGWLNEMQLEELRELQQLLEDERKLNKNLDVLQKARINLLETELHEALRLLITAESLLAKVPPEDQEEATTLRRSIVEMQLELETWQRRGARPASRGWHVPSEEKWIEELRARNAEDDRIRAERLAAFDRENSMPRSEDPDDDEFYSGMIVEG